MKNGKPLTVKNNKDINLELALQYKQWLKNPLRGIKFLFGVDPDEQQKKLIKAFWKDRARVAVKSCQGGGKTSSLVWLTFLCLLILEDCRILVTSPSSNQLSRVFYTEMLKWHNKMPNEIASQFEITRESVRIKRQPGAVKQSPQYGNLVTANPSNMENLQGGHSKNYIIMVDEASGVERSVFEILIGTLGVGKTKLIATSNPVRSSGFFYEIFSREIKGWDRLTFTAFKSGLIDEQWIEEMANTYGEDSDAYAIRVKGEFGVLSEEQFIPTDSVEQARSANLELTTYGNFPKVCGVDIARYGNDKSVIVLRQGPKILNITSFVGLNTMELANEIVQYRNKFNPSIFYIDGIGVGGGVVDRCKELNIPCQEIIVSNKATDIKRYSNQRAEIWGSMKDWLMGGADIPPHDDLFADLVAMTYTYTKKLQIQMTSKKDLKRQGIASPDFGDALALTFADTAYIMRHVVTKPRQIKKSNFLWV